MLVPDFDRIGGYERQAFTLSKALSRRNLSVFILTNKMQKLLPSYEKRDNISIYRIWPLGGYRLFFRYAILLSFFWFFLCNYKKIDVIHSHAVTHLSVMSILLGKLFGIKSVVKIATGGDLTKIMHSPLIKYRLLISFLKYADSFISLSGTITNELLEIGIPIQKIFLIFNGVDTQLFRPADVREKRQIRKEINLDSKRVVLFIGRLVKRKGVDVLLEAWKDVIKRHSKSHLLIIGFGQEMESLVEQSRRINIEKNVSFLGKRNKVTTFLQASDIFVVPSLREGNPNVLLEALSSGLPIVATRIGGIMEIIENQRNGILISPNNTGELAESISLLLGDSNLCSKLAEEARNTAISNYSIDVIGSNYIDLYSKLCPA